MRPLGAASVLALAWLAPVCAWAQDVEVEGFFVTSIGFTDNVDNRSSSPPVDVAPGQPPPPPEPEPEADGFTALSPSVALVYTRPRWVFRSSYTFNTSLYFSNPEANTVGNAVGLASRFETSDRTSLLLTLGAEQGQLNQVVVGQTASQGTVQFIDPGSNVYFRFSAGQGLEIQASENVSVLQTLDASIYIPLDGQRVQNYGGTLGVVRTFNYDSLGLTGGVTYTKFEGFEQDGQQRAAATQQVFTRLTGTWIHNYSDYLSHQLDVGILMGMRADDGGGRLVQPVGRAAVRYLRPEANASIEYAHDAGPDPFLGTNVLTDTVTARLLVPITQTELAVEGSGGFSQARIIDRAGTLHDPANLWAGDVALLWAPAGVRGNLQMALRYQVVNQGRPDDLSDPSVNYLPPRDYRRNTVLLSVTAAYPDIERATAPAGSAPPYRPSPTSTGGGFLEEPDPSAPEGPETPDTPSGPRAPATPGSPAPND
jgi:hypothetical protein